MAAVPVRPGPGAERAEGPVARVVAGPGVAQADGGGCGGVPLTVDGVARRARPGDTVATVLLATGRAAWRTTRGGDRPRGVFCGIGVCHDCLVVVNGLPDVRACLREVASGDVVETQRGAVLPGPATGAGEDSGGGGAGVAGRDGGGGAVDASGAAGSTRTAAVDGDGAHGDGGDRA
ncbi:(2Fe-2S)-binding protein [Streptomyces buecherae]|uniref:(2Fe-2S)-binding protein n=1 Tax=Streptomyces buecherae TaxID=2763006 RepID=UPI003557E30A